MAHIFVSYSKKNKDYALMVVNKLLDEGFDVWIDNRRLRSSDDWWRSIVEALRDCGAFVVILTPESDASEWVQLEITLAMKYKKARFPLWLAGSMDTTNWALFARTQYIDVTNAQLPPADFYEDLAKHVQRKPHRGSNVTATGSLDKKIAADPIFQEALNNPPQHDEHNGDDAPDAIERGEQLVSAGKQSLISRPLMAIGAVVILLLVVAGIVLSRPPSTTPTVTPPNTIAPTQIVVVNTIVPEVTNAAEVCADTDLDTPQTTIDCLNAERREEGGSIDFTLNQVLQQAADDHLIFLKNLSLDDLDSTNLCFEDNKYICDTAAGYSGMVQMIAYGQPDKLTFPTLISLINGNDPDLLTHSRDYGLAQDYSSDTNTYYFVLAFGTGS